MSKFNIGDAVIIMENPYRNRMGKVIEICGNGYYIISTNPHAITYGNILKFHESLLYLTDATDEDIDEFNRHHTSQIYELFHQALIYYTMPELEERKSIIGECIKDNYRKNGAIIIEVSRLSNISLSDIKEEK